MHTRIRQTEHDELCDSLFLPRSWGQYILKFIASFRPSVTQSTLSNVVPLFLQNTQTKQFGYLSCDLFAAYLAIFVAFASGLPKYRFCLRQRM